MDIEQPSLAVNWHESSHVGLMQDETKRKLNPTVLVLLETYLPGYKAGGPIRSIANIVRALGDEFKFRIVTLDRDHGETVPYPNIHTGTWTSLDGVPILYLSPGLRGLLSMCSLLRSVKRDHVLYLNSVFARRSSLVPLFMCWLRLCRPRRIVLAPRGEFMPGALSIKPLRKRLFIRAARWSGLFRGVLWNATSELEREEIMRRFPTSTAIDLSAGSVAGALRHEQVQRSLITNVPEIAFPELIAPTRPRKVSGRLTILFLARIARIKNLSAALQAVAGLSGDIVFDIYGPQEDNAYWRECLQRIDRLPANIRVRYCGAVEHNRTSGIFGRYDVFLLPTCGESFGHVIYEALSAGCPVLISDRTPWHGLEAEGAGWELPLEEPGRFRTMLQWFVEADEQVYCKFAQNAHNYLRRRLPDPTTIDAHRQLFRLAAAKG